MKNIFTLVLAALFTNFTANSSPALLSPTTTGFAQFRSNLYIVSKDGSTVLMDGALTQFDSGYSNNLDGMDARKMSNFSENWGMLRGTTTLVIERRHSIVNTDSVFFRMWNMHIINYQVEFIVSNLNKLGRIGVLEDKFLHTSTPVDLNGTTHVNFSVTGDPASAASDRFRVIFTNLPSIGGPLPLTYTYVNAYQQNNSVNIDWKTANEINVKQYDIERSSDGTNFEKLISANANNQALNHYNWTDINPVEGNNYYRLRSIDFDGKFNFSEILKVYVGKINQGFNVYPNPATGYNFNLQFTNQQAGKYEIRLLNTFGQTFMSRSIQHKGGSSTENINPGQNIPKGIYQLEIKNPAGDKKVISVLLGW